MEGAVESVGNVRSVARLPNTHLSQRGLVRKLHPLAARQFLSPEVLATVGHLHVQHWHV